MSKFKVGDRVRLTKDNDGYGVAGDTGYVVIENGGADDCRVKFDRTIRDRHEWWVLWSGMEHIYSSCAAAEVDSLADEYGGGRKVEFREGDMVRVVRHCNWHGSDIKMGVPVGETRKIVRKTAQLANEGVDTFLLEGDDRYFYTPLNLEHAAPATATTLRIEAGKFYKTRDGRKVGPMSKFYDDGRCYSSDNLLRGGLWKPGGTAWFDGVKDSPDLIAEWTELTLADIVARNSQIGTAIVAVLENGQPRPATRPYVHTTASAAETEANRLARSNPGKEFGVYTLGAVAKVEKTYDHEWQRRAMSGDFCGAKRILRDTSGITNTEASAAVLSFKKRAA